MRHMLIALPLVGCLALQAGLSPPQKDTPAKDATPPTSTRSNIEFFLPGDAQRKAGLDKLTEEERKVLDTHLGNALSFLYRSRELGDSAVSYLKDHDSWEEVEVRGTRTIKDEDGDTKQFLVVEQGATKYILNLDYHLPLRRGTYLAKTSSYRVEIIDRDGSTQDYTVEREE